MFADEGCTQYYDGSETNEVFVRVNQSFGPTSGYYSHTGEGENQNLTIVGPDQVDPDDEYGVTVYVDFQSDILESITAGDVIRCHNAFQSVAVNNPMTVFMPNS